jgi:hypothetical protein
MIHASHEEIDVGSKRVKKNNMEIDPHKKSKRNKNNNEVKLNRPYIAPSSYWG